jgi:tryptophanyl-tRNA synthetase
LQHLEITRDVASFNHQMGETFVIPEAKNPGRQYAYPWDKRRKNEQMPITSSTSSLTKHCASNDEH